MLSHHFSGRLHMDRESEYTQTLTKPKLKKPSMYGVVILNDDFTVMQFVVKVLIQVFHLGLDEATRLMFQIHKEGKTKIGQYTYEVADTKATLVIEMARQQEHPLHAFAEPL
jgi:ATP-dependent Clp protease adaptor protein ClpS